ncbi:MAG: dodecin family protein [Proteobacteria bacterium]|nr:dodecin family protein [Pseudomonadota bacterium]
MIGTEEGSVYKMIEVVGVSSTSWEDAATNAIRTTSKSIHDLRIAKVLEQDIVIEEGKPTRYRAKLSISFKYHGDK